jgi:hypothetical protein
MRGKSHRKEVAKKLQEQIAATTDPKLIIELSNQLSKFLPRPRQARRPRKPEATSPTKKARSLRELCPDSQSSHGNLVLNYLVVQIEKRRKAGELQTKAEYAAFVVETLKSLTDEDRAAYEALCTEAAQRAQRLEGLKG